MNKIKEILEKKGLNKFGWQSSWAKVLMWSTHMYTIEDNPR